MKLIMPMAGNGQRFFDDGYDLPKPLIDIKGKPMFKRVIDNLKVDVEPVCIVRQDHVNDYEIDKKIIEHQPNAKIVIVPGLTEGAACTVRLAASVLNTDPMMVANCDQLMVWNSDEFYDLAKANAYTGGLIPTFISDNPEPKHSYIEISPLHDVLRVYEKQKVSNVATVGVYYFQSEADWCNAHEDQMKANDRTNNEFYLAPTYNYVKGNIGYFQIDEMLGMGTPEELKELKQSEWWDKLDEIS